MKRKRRTAAEVDEIKEAYRAELYNQHPMTLRQVHYRLVARADTTYRNNQADYNALSKWLVRDRLDGIIPWEFVEDRMREPRYVQMWSGLSELTEAVLRSYRRDVWDNQPSYLEVIVEKDALSGIFEEVLRPYGVTLNVQRGYGSWTSLKEIADRCGSGEGVALLYFGDFDPSGEDMARSLEERLSDSNLPGGGCFPEITKCALTYEDIAEYQLPPDFAKSTDTRRAAFVEQYGDVAVELDALPLDVLRGRIRSEVEARMDLDALSETRHLERQDRDELRGLLS